MFNKHRLSFINANALKPRAVGAKATCTKKEGQSQMVFCTVEDINEEASTCTINFGSAVLGVRRCGVPLTNLRPIPENSQAHNI
jgi:hypothetical protein